MGKPDLRIHFDDEIESSVTDILIHPSWNANSENYDADIAIVVLAKLI